MNVRMPDGTLIKNVPDDVTQEDLLDRYSQYSQPQGNAVQQAISNIPGSASKYATDIAQTVMHPMDTLTGLQSLVSGAAQKIPGVSSVLDSVRESLPNLPIGSRQDIPVADAVGHYYKDRFGGLENIRNTLIKDPVGAVADLSVVAGGASTGLRAAGLARAAQVANTVSRFTDPLAATTNAVKAVGTPIYKGTLGQTTGAGGRVIGEALEGSPEFVSSMRGNTTEAQVADKAKDALDEIRQARGDKYRAELADLKTANQEIPIDSIKTLADEQLNRFGVKKTADGLDFSRSTASGQSAKEIDEVYKLVQDWGSQPGDLTPAMLDVLKRRLDDFYAEGRTSRAMVTTLKNAVQQKIVSSVPEYAKMTADYAKTTGMIKEMERAVGLGDKTSADTTIRKLTTALREDKNFRSDLLKTLKSSTGENVSGAVAGTVMRPPISRSLGSIATSTGAGVGAVGTLMSGGLGALVAASPVIAGVMALASPRLVGELSVLLGRLGKVKARAPEALGYQVGRLPLGNQNGN
jgi:hypothetical protein